MLKGVIDHAGSHTMGVDIKTVKMTTDPFKMMDGVVGKVLLLRNQKQSMPIVLNLILIANSPT